MRYRANSAKPCAAMWALVVLGNVALILAGLGMAVLIALSGVATIGVAAVVGMMLMRRGLGEHEPASGVLPARAGVRRRH